MDIRILQLVEGAKEARGIAVVIDVFRAISVESYLTGYGAKEILPIGDAELAYRLKREHPDWLLAGERHGKILPGFDLGNSPSELNPELVAGKTVVHTTSAGTQGIANANGADEILGASLVNAKATAEYIRRSGAREVSLVCMGLEARAETEEDTLCARYIRAILLGETLDVRREADRLRYTSGAKFFDPAQNDVFPEKDFGLCIDIDRFDFALRYTKGADGLGRMVRV